MPRPGRDSFREALESDAVILCDGAMGTALYGKGIFIHRAFEELNLTQPALVREVHQEYLDAGAMVLETNTFAANRFRLSPHGLADRVDEINRAGVRLARQAADGRAWVAGAIGPLGVRIEPFGPIGREEAREVFRQQIAALVAAGVDLLLLETFNHLPEAEEALAAAREVDPTIPVVAQVVVTADGVTREGVSAGEAAGRLARAGASMVGVNCCDALAALEGLARMREATDLPLSVQPNAGSPRDVGGRKMYLASPDYAVAWARRAVKGGARLIGGCCGTTPDHVRALTRVAAGAHVDRSEQATKLREVRATAAAPVPRTEKSILASALAAKRYVYGVELPATRGWVTDEVVTTARRLALAGATFVSLPEGPPHGAFLPPLAQAQLCRYVGIEAVVHYSCRGRRLARMQSDLLGAFATGVANVILVTGDPTSPGARDDVHDLEIDSIGAVNLASRLNHGEDIGRNPIGRPTGFHVGVRFDPTAHDMEREFARIAWKVDAGAEYLVTSPVFDPAALERAVAMLPEPRTPVIATIWPLRSAREAEFFERQLANVPVPEPLAERMRQAEAEGREPEEGVAIAKELAAACKPLVNGLLVVAPGGRVNAALEVIDAVR